MKKYLKKTTKSVLEPILSKFGYEKIKVSKNKFKKESLLKVAFENMISMGFSPKHIVDVGANRGAWTRETLKYFPNAYYTLLEPQAWLKFFFQDLLDTNPKINLHECGAGSQSGVFNFTVTNRDDSSSFRFSKQEAQKEGFKQIEIPVVSIDELIGSLYHLPFPDIVKIDAEGLDIEVLKGAKSLLGKTEVFLVEAAVGCELFDNTILKVMNFMDEYDYTLFDISDLNRPFTPKILWLTELVFVKKQGFLNSNKLSFKI